MGSYQTVHQLVDEVPRVEANPLFTTVESPGIGATDAGLALELTPPAASRAPAPLLGEHTEEILGDVLGLSGADIGRLTTPAPWLAPEAVDDRRRCDAF